LQLRSISSIPLKKNKNVRAAGERAIVKSLGYIVTFKWLHKERFIYSEFVALTMAPEKRLLNDLIHFPGLTRGGQHKPTDIWVSPDWKESWLEGLRKHYGRFNPPTDSIGDLLFLEALLAIDSSESAEVRKSLMSTLKTGKVAIVTAHAGIYCPGQDDKWRYKVGNGEYPSVEELLGQMDIMGYDMLYFAMCNRGGYELQPKQTMVIQLMGSPADGPWQYILRKPKQPT
jgi:hypothetical protein